MCTAWFELAAGCGKFGGLYTPPPIPIGLLGLLGLVLAERPAKCPFGVRASPSRVHWTTRSLWTVHGLDPSAVPVESDLPVSWSSSDSLLLYFKKYLC
jgi:hypothetical protein